MNRRIALVLRTKNISPSQFAEDLGVQRSGISHILNGRNKPSLEFIQKLIKKYPDISMNWLMFGEGPMMNPYPGQETVVAKPTPIQPSKPVMMELFGTAQEGRHTEAQNLVSSNRDDDTSLEQNEQEEETVAETKPLINKQTEPKQDIFKQSAAVNAGYIASKLTHNTENSLYQPADGRKIKRIVIFYDDRSFVEYKPGEE